MSKLLSFIFEPFKNVSDTNRFNKFSSKLMTVYVDNRLELKTWLGFNTDLNSHAFDNLDSDYSYQDRLAVVERYAENPKDLFQKLTFILNFLQTSILCIPGQIYNILALALDYALASIASIIHLAICLPLLLIKFTANSENFKTANNSVQTNVNEYTVSIFELLQSFHRVVLTLLDAAAYVIAIPLTPLAFGVIKVMGWDKKQTHAPKTVTTTFEAIPISSEPVPEAYIQLGAFRAGA